MTLETWLLFSGAALVVILIPGPLSLLMISNSLNYGLRRSYPAFLGGVFASICLLSASAWAWARCYWRPNNCSARSKLSAHSTCSTWRGRAGSNRVCPMQALKFRTLRQYHAFVHCLAGLLYWAPATPRTSCFSLPSCHNFSAASNRSCRSCWS